MQIGCLVTYDEGQLDTGLEGGSQGCAAARPRNSLKSTAIAHSFGAAAANESDLANAHCLPHGGGAWVWGDSGHRGVEKRDGNLGRGVEWRVAMGPAARGKLDPAGAEARRQREEASVRAKVGRLFFYVKRMFGYSKVRHRGLHKNERRIAPLLGFANLLITERRLAV